MADVSLQAKSENAQPAAGYPISPNENTYEQDELLKPTEDNLDAASDSTRSFQSIDVDPQVPPLKLHGMPQLSGIRCDLPAVDDYLMSAPTMTPKLQRLSTDSLSGNESQSGTTYGTFGAETVDGRLFELQTFLAILTRQLHYYFFYAVLASLIWPLGLLLAIPTGIAGNVTGYKSLQMLTLFLVLGFIIGVALWVPAISLLMIEGKLPGFVTKTRSVFDDTSNYVELLDFVTSQVIILLTIAFGWVFHEITVELVVYKQLMMESWHSRHNEWGMEIVFNPSQLNHIKSILGIEKDKDHLQNKLFMDDLVTLLEQIPGWTSVMDAMTEEIDFEPEETGLYKTLSTTAAAAKSRGLWAIDIFTVRTQYQSNLTVSAGLCKVCKQFYHLLRHICAIYTITPISLVFVTFLSAVRAVLPHIWVHWIHHSKTGNPLRLALTESYSFLVTFVTSLVWMSVFFTVLESYRRNRSQVNILTAIVDPKTRLSFGNELIKGDYALSADDAEEVLGKLPVLTLRQPCNCAAFWRLRQYVTLDRSNERVAISLFLEILLMWLGVKFAFTLGAITLTKAVPAMLIVTLFDLVVFGWMMVFSLQTALQMNDMMDMHTQVFVQAKYHLTLASEQIDKSSPEFEMIHHDLQVARGLLEEFVCMAQECDHRDKILLGVLVTPGMIFTTAASIFGAIVMLLLEKAAFTDDLMQDLDVTGFLRKPSYLHHAHTSSIDNWGVATRFGDFLH